MTIKKISTEALFLAIASIICLSLSLYRCYITDSGVFLFLNWDLFLAMIPWAVVTLLKLVIRIITSSFLEEALRTPTLTFE